GPHHIPERDGDEEVNRPAIAPCPCGHLASTNIVDRAECDEGQWNDFKRTEYAAPCQRDRRRAGEVQVMTGADNATRKVDRRREQRGARRRRGPDQANAREEEGDHSRGEHFEEAFDPEVNDPPAPVFDHRKVRVLTPGEPSTIEEADGGARDDE